MKFARKSSQCAGEEQVHGEAQRWECHRPCSAVTGRFATKPLQYASDGGEHKLASMKKQDGLIETHGADNGCASAARHERLEEGRIVEQRKGVPGTL